MTSAHDWQQALMSTVNNWFPNVQPRVSFLLQAAYKDPLTVVAV